MRRSVERRVGYRRAWTVPLLLVLAGCSGSSGARFALFPNTHRLVPAAQAMRTIEVADLPVPRELDKDVTPPFMVEPGDVLLVQPADLDSAVRLPGDQAVLPDGTINLGRYGPVQVAGKTVEEISVLVRAALEAQTPNVGPLMVRLVSRQSKVYYVLGEVNAPGSFPLTGRETVLDGILAAGGLNDRAGRQHIILSRPTHPHSCRVLLPVCYHEIVQLGDTSTNYQLQPGDRIFVPTQRPWEDWWSSQKKNCPCARPQVPCLGSLPCAELHDPP